MSGDPRAAGRDGAPPTVRLPEHAEVVVVGAGLMGAAAAWALSLRGHDVVVLEARRAGHREGSSHGSSRIFRRSYLEPHYVAMTGAAERLWRRLEDRAGRRILTTTGGLDHGPGREPERLREALAAGGAECELVPAGEAGRRWPHMVFAGPAVYHPSAGVIDPELAVAEMLRLAARHGALVAHEQPVLALERSDAGADAGVVLHAAAGRVRAATVVAAAGPWIGELLRGVVPLPALTVTQQQVFHFARRRDAGGDPWPVVLHDAGTSIFALPGGRDGGAAGNMKLAEHIPGPVTTADTRDGLVDPGSRERVTGYVREWWPGLEVASIAEFSCLYTWADDHDFVIDRAGPIVVCSPCSGHGAKFAPLVGEWAADLVEGRALPYAQFGLARRRLA